MLELTPGALILKLGEDGDDYSRECSQIVVRYDQVFVIYACVSPSEESSVS